MLVSSLLCGHAPQKHATTAAHVLQLQLLLFSLMAMLLLLLTTVIVKSTPLLDFYPPSFHIDLVFQSQHMELTIYGLVMCMGLSTLHQHIVFPCG